MSRTLHLLVPGKLDQRTGGYLYDARMASGLRALGWTVEVHELPGTFPVGDADARAGLSAALAGIPDGELAVLDGLAMGALPDVLKPHRARLRLVSLVHHPLAEETGLDSHDRDRFQRLEAAALEQVRGVVVTSAFTARRIRDWGVDPGRVRVVEPGTERIPTHARHPGDESGVARILSVGSVTPRKGQDVLVEALAALRDLPWRCVVAGSLHRDPEFAGAVERRVEAQGLEERILLTGELDTEALTARYTEADVFVLPSHYEGYGMVLAEALMHGLPVVSTTGGAIPFTVPPDAGILVRPGDAEALAGALRSILEDPARRRALADAARTHGDALPGWDAQAVAFEAAVTELADLG